jgi:hypothetical protein
VIARLIYGVPVIGWILREAAEGPASTKALFLVNCILLWVLAILVFGYPAIIIPALCLVPTMFVVLILITKG